MGIYVADVTFENAPHTWEELFERAKRRYGKACELETRPQPGRREHAVMRSANRGEDIDLHRHDGKISFGHGPQVFPFARAVHRALADFGGIEDGFDRVALVPGADTRVSLKDLVKRLRPRVAKIALEHDASWDPPLDTAHGPLLAEGTIAVVDRAPAFFEVRVHHRIVRIARRTTGERDAVWNELIAALEGIGCTIAP